MSASGGAGALLADHSSEYGLPMAEFSPHTAERLEKVLPAFARKANPIDLTGQINTDPELFRNCCEAVSADPRTEAVVVQFSSSGRRYMQANGDVFKALAQDLPVVVGFIGEMMETEVQQGVPGGWASSCRPIRRPPCAHCRGCTGVAAALALPKSRDPARSSARPAPRDWAEIMQFSTTAVSRRRSGWC